MTHSVFFSEEALVFLLARHQAAPHDKRDEKGFDNLETPLVFNQKSCNILPDACGERCMNAQAENKLERSLA